MTKTKWAVDRAHSSIDFAIRHLMVSNVKGTFHAFSAVIEADPANLTTANIAFTVDLESVDTHNKERDAHLLTPDFFDIDKFPQMTFLANNIVETGENKYDMIGEFSLHGVTRSETFAVTYEGAAKDPAGQEKIGFRARGSINRKDYELNFNKPLETGGVLLGDQVNISLDILASKET
ncbi:YceI family protein [Domibacillus epiphyticus]|uniref:Lipid/polyisoprenoid-binding YceI-like domain-containing protein n=1 Tax=Domibacillus epiphyticus TaxID=1714355 RepID=A0A1V2AA92_9BACI|nr:YceI family protein [Domibacillus epiphyticus]OMP67860.1 hypothetical protein BTO28_05075 [Domibacillus epiphyticus]